MMVAALSVATVLAGCSHSVGTHTSKTVARQASDPPLTDTPIVRIEAVDLPLTVIYTPTDLDFGVLVTCTADPAYTWKILINGRRFPIWSPDEDGPCQLHDAATWSAGNRNVWSSFGLRAGQPVTIEVVASFDPDSPPTSRLSEDGALRVEIDAPALVHPGSGPGSRGWVAAASCARRVGLYGAEG